MNTINVPHRSARREPMWVKIAVVVFVAVEWAVIGLTFIPRW